MQVKVIWISIQTLLMHDMFLIYQHFRSFKDNLDNTKGCADQRADKGGEKLSIGESAGR